MPAKDRYTAMRDAINKTGRPIYISICNCLYDDPESWAPSVGNSYRTHKDIDFTYNTIMKNFRENMNYSMYSGPGHWADPDMLEIGVNLEKMPAFKNLTFEE